MAFKRRVRRFKRRTGVRRRNGPIRTMVRQYKKRQGKKRFFNRLKKLDDRVGFTFSRFISNGANLVAPSPAANPLYSRVVVRLSDVTAASEQIDTLRLLYNWYRLRKVVVKIQPLFTQLAFTSTSASPPFYIVGSVIDNTNATPPANSATDWAQWSNGASYRETRGNRTHTRVVKFRPAEPVGDSSTLVSYSRKLPKSSPWISTSSLGVDHYGLQYFWYNMNGAYTGTVPFHLQVKTYWAFKEYKRLAPL